MAQVACTMLPNRLFVFHFANLSKIVFPFLLKFENFNQVNAIGGQSPDHLIQLL